MVTQMRRRLGHAPRGAMKGTHPALAGEGHKVVVPAVVAAGARKASEQRCRTQILCKRFAHEGLGRAAVALAIELARAGKVQPGLVVLGDCLVQQRALGMAGL